MQIFSAHWPMAPSSPWMHRKLDGVLAQTTKILTGGGARILGTVLNRARPVRTETVLLGDSW